MLSLITIDDTIVNIPVQNKDKIVHFLFYFIFVALWSSYIKIAKKSKNYQWYVFMSAVLFGIMIELCQIFFTATRQGDIKDVFANSVGALMGSFFVTVTNKIFSKK